MTGTELMIRNFNFDGNQLTTITGKGEKPWFIAKEVCDILKYKNARKAVKDHCKYVKLLRGNESLRLGFNPRGVNIINRSDVFRLIAHSKLPAAERFEEWIYDEVLPAIFDTGGYIQGEKEMTDEELIDKAFMVIHKKLEIREMELKEEREKLQIANNTIQEQQPKAEFYDDVAKYGKLLTLTEFANLYVSQPKVKKYVAKSKTKIGRRMINLYLRQQKYTYGKFNKPYQKTINAGLMVVKLVTSAGFPQTCLTPKGVRELRKINPINIEAVWALNKLTNVLR